MDAITSRQPFFVVSCGPERFSDSLLTIRTYPQFFTFWSGYGAGDTNFNDISVINHDLSLFVVFSVFCLWFFHSKISRHPVQSHSHF